MTEPWQRAVAPASLEALIARCPFGRLGKGCVPLDGDRHLVRLKRGVQVHRHDHRACVPLMASLGENPVSWAWHPEDPEDDWHHEPWPFHFARHPLQREWPSPWQVLASSIVSAQTSGLQAFRALHELYRAVFSPAYLVTAPLEEILAPVGSRPIPFLLELGRQWEWWANGPRDSAMPRPETVAGWRGVGPVTLELYSFFVWDVRPEQWLSPLLCLADSMGRLEPAR